MEILNETIIKQLVANGTQQDKVRGTEQEIDFFPVVKLFTPDANCTWLLTEIDPEHPDIAFGLCDLGMGFPELGNVSIAELRALRGVLGLPVERDLYFEPAHPLSVFTRAAQTASAITTSAAALEKAASEMEAGQ